MCLAVPMQVMKITGDKGLCTSRGVSREVDLRMVPGIKGGDYVIVHAGFAIQILDEDEAKSTLAILREAGL